MLIRVLSVVIAIAALGVLATAAVAQGPQGAGPGDGEHKPPMLFGKLTSISSTELTLKPEIPEKMQQRMQERGRELPQLPDSITVKLDSSTKWYFNSAAGKASDFKAGDEVVVKVSAGLNTPLATAVADPETAKQYIMERMRERRGEGGKRGGRGFGGPDGERGMGPGGPDGERKPPVLYGRISMLSTGSMTLKPEIPEEMQQRLKDKGRELPDLPESVSVQLGRETQWYADGKEATAASFSAGDTVVVKLERGEGEDPVAQIVADPETAKTYIKERLHERFGRGGGEGLGVGPEGGAPRMGPDGPDFGPGGPDGPGMGPGGPGEHGGRDRHPAFGVITKLSADSITIKPEVPDFIAKRMQEKGRELPGDLPETLTFNIGERTRFAADGEKADRSQFKVGDKVAVMAFGDPKSGLTAGMITDLATAQQKMDQRLERGGPGGPDGPLGPPPHCPTCTCPRDDGGKGR
jgi:hypothetical protein